MSNVSILGAGLMGAGIGALLIHHGMDVTIWDKDDKVGDAERSVRQRALRVQEEETQRELSPTPGALTAVTDLGDAVSAADFVIECLSENIAIKRPLLQAADRHAPHGAIFVTNTSSIALQDLRDCVEERRPLVAAHFFNPAEIIPGVEVAIARPSDRAAADAVVELLRSVGKAPVKVAPSPGFIGNRLQLALFREAVLCVEEGIASAEDIDEIVRSSFGFRLPVFGPFAIADMAGLHVFEAILENLRSAFGERFDVPASLRDRVASGNTGLTSGAGFRTYATEDQSDLLRHRDAAYRAVLDAVERTASPWQNEEISHLPQ